MKRQELRNCPTCGLLVAVKVRATNNVLHAILTLLTMGLWLPIWLLMMLESRFSRVKIKCNCRRMPDGEIIWRG